MIIPDCKFVEEFSRAFPSCSLNRCPILGLITSGTPAPFSSTSENDITLVNDNGLTYYTLLDKFIGTLIKFPPYFQVKILKNCLDIYTKTS